MGIDELARDDDDKHRRLIYRLQNAGTKADRCLANVLARCTVDRPCRSAACIHCGRDFQRLALGTVEQRIRAPAYRELRGRVSAFTIVPTVGGGPLKNQILIPLNVVPSADGPQSYRKRFQGSSEWARDGPEQDSTTTS